MRFPRYLRRFGLLLLSVVLMAAFVPGAAAEGKRRPPFRLGAHVVPTNRQPHVRRGTRGGRHYDPERTHTIEFDLFRRARNGRERPSELRLYLPNGDLYRALPFTPTAPDTGVSKNRQPVATAVLPVSGTLITRYRLYGRWRAEVCWEDGADTECRHELTFVIDR